VNREIILAWGKCLELRGEMEAKDVLSCCDPGGFISYLASEINSPEFIECSVAVAAVLSGFTTRPLAHLLFLLTRRDERATRARESGTGVHLGHGNTILASENARPTRK